MKAIPYVIIGIVVLSLMVNLLLLFDKTWRESYYWVANIVTGVSLVSIVLLTIYSRKKIKGLQSDFIHRIFHKN